MTPVNIVLLTAFCSLVTGLLVRFFMLRSMVTTRACEEHRKISRSACEEHRQSILRACEERHKAECRTTAELKRDLRIVFRMLRALIAYSNIPQDVQADILNTRGDD